MSRRGFGRCAATVALTTLSACGLVSGLDDLHLVNDDGGGPLADASHDANGDDARPVEDDASLDATDGAPPPDSAPPNRCPVGRGPPMSLVTAIDGRTFCIDTTEVTQAQYRDFLLATAGDAAGQRASCTWNDSFAPGAGGCPVSSFQPDTQGNRPVVCIDWCDAAAYCAWAGKRLCGQIGGGPLQGFFGGAFDPGKSQWYAACTHNGARAYPYGDTYAATSCNGVEQGAGGTVAVGSLGGCVGGFDALRDMSGNVMEMEDGCDETDGGPQNGICHARGGGFADDKNALRCDSDLTFLVIPRRSAFVSVGVRCCAD